MLMRVKAPAGWLTLAVSIAGCAVYGPDLVASSSSVDQGGSFGMSGGGGASTAGTGATATQAGAPASGATGGASAGTAGSAGGAGKGPEDTEPYVSGGTHVPPTLANLAHSDARDWGHWGLKTGADFNHRAGVITELLEFKAVGSESPQFKLGGPITFTWNGGTPTAMATTSNGVTWTGLDQGFEMIVAANEDERRVNLFIGVMAGTAEITATLSDPLATSQLDDQIESPDDQWNLRLLTIEYGFATEGTELTITLKITEAVNATAAVSLHGVTFDTP
jgi:hypothetical protein